MSDASAGVKSKIKATIAWLVFHLGLHRLFSRGRAIIVVFHRVEDRYAGTPINSTRAEFAAYLTLFKRFYTVVSLGDLLDRLEHGRDVSNCLAITFDDGYVDNYRDAAPILSRFGLPACFFVITNFIGSTCVPWWDRDMGIESEWMTWDQVRALHAQGFDIGAHTMSHVDLGETTGDAAFGEIAGSKARLEAELGAPVRYFSYPYGGRQQMAEENREAVRRAGLVCCLSAFGGVVQPGDSPYHLKRSPITPWYLSAYQFGFAALFHRT